MKRGEFLKEIRGQSADELRARALSVAEELMKLRFRKVTGQLEQSHRVRILKRERARIQTVLGQQQRQQAEKN